MNNYFSLHKTPVKAQYRPGDYLVIFGEVFGRGYVNGLIQEAQKYGLEVIYSTVGRRETGVLRKLNTDELSKQPSSTINVPLEAGFDLEKSSDGTTPCDQVKDIKMDDWLNAKLNWQSVSESESEGTKRFTTHVRDYFRELRTKIKPGKNVFIAHLMAGGVPRAKIFMAVLNRVVKPKADKFIPSQVFWNSDLGILCDKSFNAVTADTFKILVEESKDLQKTNPTRFSAYGYHGTEISTGSDFFWQSYAPYIQGWAKVCLENHSASFQKNSVKTCVYNCPEILTNSSSIFQGVEVPLYPLLSSFKKLGADKKYTKDLLVKCQELLRSDKTIDDLLDVTRSFYNDPEIKSNFNVFEKFPQHNNFSQMQKLVDCSNRIIEMHQDEKNLVTFVLSEEILKGTGQLIFHDSYLMPKSSVWLNHDIIVKHLLSQSSA
ncbi:MAG: hypothetical protein A4S09_11145 [Proteobacteria bacterium SG_bin7]|nr:MAG: hypothetical protein A4S09_11145 [Proteobacteria bacterium SG_bin7]